MPGAIFAMEGALGKGRLIIAIALPVLDGAADDAGARAWLIAECAAPAALRARCG
jgi:hypothetical protein